jgi:3-oxoacyl-[acyl-carrier-protein] synthase-3
MTTSVIGNVHVRGIASAVPAQRDTWDAHTPRFGDDAARIAESTGVRSRRVAGALCTSDLCLAAAEKLLGELGWDRAAVDVLVFVTQTPDYLLPATACVLHGRLGLATHCAAFDVGLGCSGYVYGLWLAAHLLGSGAGSQRP